MKNVKIKKMLHDEECNFYKEKKYYLENDKYYYS